MMIPSHRLLWFVAFCFVPACAMPAIVPGGERYVGFTALAIFVIAAIDALVSWRNLDGLTIVLPENIRAYLNREQSFSIELHRSASAMRSPRTIRVAVFLPVEIDTVKDDTIVPAPALGSGSIFQMVFLGKQRGQFTIDKAFLGSNSVLGLWQLRRTLSLRATILVQPSLSLIARETAKLIATREHGGQRIIARNGRGREFEQLREYTPSDNFGDIDWKATARRRAPIVRDYQVERTQDIYACIDFSRLSGRQVVSKADIPVTILDEYIRSALMLHCAVQKAGDRFGLATFSNRIGYFVKSTAAASFEPAFRRALYPLRPRLVAPAYDEICGVIRNRIKRRALIIFFTSLAEPQLAESFLAATQLLARQHLIVVACPTDAYAQPIFTDGSVEQIDEIYDKLAGHLLWKKLAEVRFQLANIGIRMHTVAPGRLGLVAATEYLDVKERQLL
jgi:uncharacterized protein (DUF58 family)